MNKSQSQGQDAFIKQYLGTEPDKEEQMFALAQKEGISTADLFWANYIFGNAKR